MRIRRTSFSARAALLCLAAIALVCTELATASTADAAERTIYFRDGLGASARVTFHKVVGKRVDFGEALGRQGRSHARPDLRLHERPQVRDPQGHARPLAQVSASASPVRTHFEVCTYKRNVPLRCTTRWTTS